MTSFENLSSNQKIRAALHRDVRAIGIEACHFLGLEITNSAMEIVSELVYKKLTVYGADLEAFAKHAKRATINSDDVKLLVRRCPSLTNKLNAIAPSPKEKRRKTIAGKEPETPAAKQKEAEIATSKQKVPEINKELEELQEIEKTVIDNTHMLMDEDMIDLTFD